MKRLILAIGLITFVLIGTSAQLAFGPKFGLNLSKITADEYDDPLMRTGAQFGVIAYIGLPGPLGVQPGVMYSMKGVREKYEEGGTSMTANLSLNYLEVPLNLVAGFGAANIKFQIIAGPYFAMGLSGKYKESVSGLGALNPDDQDVEFTSDVTDGNIAVDKVFINKMDMGLNFGLGLQLGKLQIQGLYGLGLSNLYPKIAGEKPDDKMTLSNIQISLALLFGKK